MYCCYSDIGKLGFLAVLVIPIAGDALASCDVHTDGMNFGIVDTERDSLATGELTISCTEPTAFAVAISSDGNGQRKMDGPLGGTLRYQLYSDASRSTIWGDDNGDGHLIGGQSDGETINQLSVYGEIPSQSPVAAGIYRDDLTLTILF